MSVDFHHLLVVYTAYIIAAASPGPSNMRIMGTAMQQGRNAALLLAAGVITGSIFWGIMAATGISALLTAYAQALVILKIAGGLYLLFLAFKAAKAAMARDGDAGRAAFADRPLSGIALYRRGLLMHLSNPKSILGWIALVALGLGPGASRQDVFLILAGCGVLSVTIFCGYALLFSTPPMVSMYHRARRGIEGVLAAFFGLAGLSLLFSRS